MTKTCTKCGETKPITSFSADRSKKHGRCAQCKKCRLAYNREHARRTGAHKRRYARERLKERERHTVRKYGVTLEAYEALRIAQGGRCAICQKQPEIRPLDIDHDHATGEVRGLLCSNCNRMLGHAGDDPTRLRNGAVYLARKSRRNLSKPT